MSENEASYGHTSTSQTASDSNVIRVCLLGSEGSGKTCFLAGLAILGEPNRPSPLMVTSMNADTASYLEELAKTVRGGEWPPSTNMTNVLSLRVGINGYIIEIVVVDYPGEDFRQALRKLDREKITTLYDHYSNADALLLLFDPHQDLSESGEIGEKQVERQMAHLQAIADIWAERSSKKPSGARKDVDIGIVLTKSDRFESLETPRQAREFFRKHAAPLDEKIRGIADKVNYFALSAIGRSGLSNSAKDVSAKLPSGGDENRFSTKSSELETHTHSQPTESPQPFGYDQILGWIQRRHLSRRNHVRNRLMLASGIVVVLLLGANYLSQGYARQKAIETLNNPNLSAVEKLRQTKGIVSDDVIERRAEFVKGKLSGIEVDLQSAETESELDSVLSALKSLRENDPGVYVSEIDQLIQAANDSKRNILFQLVKDSFDQKKWTYFEDSANRFLREYAKSDGSDNVRQMIDARRTEEQKNARARIRRISVTDISSLQGKTQRIFDFLDKYEDDLSVAERKKMKRAAELGKKFSEKQTYSVTLGRSGEFYKPRTQEVWLLVSDKVIHKYDSDDKSKIVTWPGKELKFQWQAGEPIDVVLRAGYWFWGKVSDVARMRDSGPIALRLLGGSQDLTQITSDWKPHCKKAYITFEIDGITELDWKAVDDYLAPGEAW